MRQDRETERQTFTAHIGVGDALSAGDIRGVVRVCYLSSIVIRCGTLLPAPTSARRVIGIGGAQHGRLLLRVFRSHSW